MFYLFDLLLVGGKLNAASWFTFLVYGLPFANVNKCILVYSVYHSAALVYR